MNSKTVHIFNSCLMYKHGEDFEVEVKFAIGNDSH